VEFIFVSAIIGLLLYYCWRIVLIGAIGFVVIFCGLATYFDHRNANPQQIVVDSQIAQPQQTIVQAVAKVDTAKEQYVRDCVSYGLDRGWCGRNWDGVIEENDDVVALMQQSGKP
jgi:ABC-type bacteriocin/lantibiotic exporter with double-glycine peptidase domain